MRTLNPTILTSATYAAHIPPMSDDELVRYQEYLRTNLRAHRTGYCEVMGNVWHDLHTRVKTELKKRGLPFTISISEQQNLK